MSLQKERYRYFIMKKATLILILLCSLLLSACGANAAVFPNKTPLSAEETADRLMESLRDLNLDFFNEHSDNYISTERNWLGIPTRTDYQVFDDLLQPFHRNRKRYQTNYQVSQKLMENLSWEIKDIRQEGSHAEIDMEITNIDMVKATGYYEISLLENMVAPETDSLFQFARDIIGLIRSASSAEGLTLAMDQLSEDDLSTMNVTVLAYREDSIWKIRLNEDFINAIMGNINSWDYPDEIGQKIEELTLRYEEKMNHLTDTP